MRNILFAITAALALAFTQATVCLAGSPAKAIRKGNQFYKEQKFDEALKHYNEAQTETPDSDIIEFNTGTALYKKGDYDRAIGLFTEVLTTEDPLLESKANYNIGNSKYKKGKLKENTDLGTAIGLYRESLDYYKRAIELNEKDEDAKYNHEFVEKKLKVLLDKLKQQQEQKQKDQKQGEGEKKKEEQKQAEADGEKEEEEKEEGKGEKPEETKEEQEKETEGARVPEEEQKEMSEEEARMLLEGHRQQEESKDEIKKRQRRGHHPDILKDW